MTRGDGVESGLTWRGRVCEDEDGFTGLHQAKVSAGGLFESGRVISEPAILLAQVLVVGFQPVETVGQLGVALPSAHHRHQTAVADDRVDDDNRREDQQQEMDDTPDGRSTNHRAREATTG